MMTFGLSVVTAVVVTGIIQAAEDKGLLPAAVAGFLQSFVLISAMAWSLVL